MRPAQIAALASWTDSYEFEDFLFLAGFRRYADRIVPTEISRAARMRRVENSSRGMSGIATTWLRDEALSARAAKTCRRPAFALLSGQQLDSEQRVWDESTVEIFTTVAPIASSPDGRMGREAQSNKPLFGSRAQSSARSLL